MIKRKVDSAFDSKFYDLYEMGFFSDDSYLSGRNYYDNFICPHPKERLCHNSLKEISLFRNFWDNFLAFFHVRPNS